jgi:membrane-bound lytic murein transglycosylase D
MFKYYFLLLFFPAVLFSGLTFESNYQKEVKLLRSFDIDPSFLNDQRLIRIVEDIRSAYKNRHFFRAMEDAYLYIPMIKSILTDSEVPAEFLFLAMAESNFATHAYSNKKASGLWQFMSSTGRLYGLHIDEYTDERRDPVKSTHAAVKYLSALHKRFGKWYLAALAYNCGEGRVQRAINRAGTDDLFVLLDEKKKYVPAESRRYIRKIVALTLLGSDESFLIESEYAYLLNRANAYSIATVTLPQGERLSRVAELLEMPKTDLKKLNRHLKYDFVPPYGKGCEIYIPYVKLSEFKQKYKPCDLQQIYMVHTVKSGDTLSAIGHRYGVRYTVIKDFNNLKSTRLSLKQKLIIPVTKGTKITKSETFHVYKVRSGDTLEGIAKRYRLSVKELKRANRLKNDIIRIGQQLKVGSQTKDYTVKRGDTLRSIARLHELSVAELKQKNNLTGDIIRIGERLSVYD